MLRPVQRSLCSGVLLKKVRVRLHRSVEVCTLLDKRARRLAQVDIRYVGFDAPDEFLVGYGLDYLEKYRNLAVIAVLRPNEKD